jgi:hypothetical protein
MAYLPETEQDRERRAQEQGQQGPQVASGPSGVITGQQGGSPMQQGTPTHSGAFTNINAYLNANKEQAADLSKSVAGNVANRADQAQSQLGQVDTDFRTQADQGGVKRDQDFVNKAVADPTNFVKDQNNVQRFRGIRDAVYKGPQTLQDAQGYGQAAQAVTNANQALENTKSEAGRFTLLQDQYNRPGYSHGQQSLDQMLMQNDPTSRSQFADVQNRYSGLMSQLNQKQADAQAYAAQRQAETEAATKDAQTALGQIDDPTTPENEAAGAFGGFQTDLNARTAKYKADQQAKYSRMLKQLGGGQVSTNPRGAAEMDADVLASLGLKSGQHLYDVDLSKFKPTFNADAINQQNVASSADYAKYAALAQLAGQDPTYLYDAKNAGTAPGIQFDQGALKQKLTNAQKRFTDVSKQAEGLRGAFNTINQDNFGNLGGYSNAQQLADIVNAQLKSDPTWQWANNGMTGQYADYMRSMINWAKQYNALNPNRTINARKA